MPEQVGLDLVAGLSLAGAWLGCHGLNVHAPDQGSDMPAPYM